MLRRVILQVKHNARCIQRLRRQPVHIRHCQSVRSNLEWATRRFLQDTIGSIICSFMRAKEFMIEAVCSACIEVTNCGDGDLRLRMRRAPDEGPEGTPGFGGWMAGF